jgi:hypothetical protein
MKYNARKKNSYEQVDHDYLVRIKNDICLQGAFVLILVYNYFVIKQEGYVDVEESNLFSLFSKLPN